MKNKYGADQVTAIGHRLGGGLAANSGIKKESLTIKQLDSVMSGKAFQVAK